MAQNSSDNLSSRQTSLVSTHGSTTVFAITIKLQLHIMLLNYNDNYGKQQSQL